MLSVLLSFTISDYPFGIFELFFVCFQRGKSLWIAAYDAYESSYNVILRETAFRVHTNRTTFKQTYESSVWIQQTITVRGAAHLRYVSFSY